MGEIVKTNAKAIKSAYGKMLGAGRRTIALSLEIGQMLAEDKERLPHGGYKPYLEKLGINKMTAHRLTEAAKDPKKFIESNPENAILEYEKSNKLLLLKAEKAEQKRLKRLEEAKNNPTLNVDKLYRILYVDPPWQYNDKQDTEKLGGAEKHYATMSIKELCELPVKDIAEENAVLFFWVTSPLLEEGFEIINAWGFKYKTSFIWDKVKHNMGHYNSVRHELLLVCTKGSCTPDVKKLFDSVQSIERTGKHSEKPDEFRKIIKTIYTHGEAIELFARCKNEGWDSFGNEA